VTAVAVLIVGIVLFVGVHSISIVDESWRNRVVERFGLGFWRALHSLATLVGLAMIVIGYGLARRNPIVIYMPALWTHWVVIIGMLPVFVLIFSAYLPGRIRTTMKHPVLVATKLWATVHLFANGTLADVLLFGSLLAWAVADRISMKRRPPRRLPSLPESRWNDGIAVLAGLGVYAAFVFGLHAWLIGVPVWPGVG
jgi:uncharacterized membrane protein